MTSVTPVTFSSTRIDEFLCSSPVTQLPCPIVSRCSQSAIHFQMQGVKTTPDTLLIFSSILTGIVDLVNVPMPNSPLQFLPIPKANGHSSDKNWLVRWIVLNDSLFSTSMETFLSIWVPSPSCPLSFHPTARKL